MLCCAYMSVELPLPLLLRSRELGIVDAANLSSEACNVTKQLLVGAC